MLVVPPPRAGSNNSIDPDLRERLDQSLLGCKVYRGDGRKGFRNKFDWGTKRRPYSLI